MKRKITFKKISLHDADNNSFVFGLNVESLLKLMTSMSAQHYYENYASYPSMLDRSEVSVRKLKEV